MNKIKNIIFNKKIDSVNKVIPLWIMRQAGRYLPEYRKIRSEVKDFLELCYNPRLASEVTLQPIKRFDFDAAIIFSDILVVPHAMGLDLRFENEVGPVLERVKDLRQLVNDEGNILRKLQPIFETISITRSKLDKQKSLIGFSGSPWTLACYMIEGKGKSNFASVLKKALQDEVFFLDLINILTENIIFYLKQQIRSGVDVVKLFDSWSGLVPPYLFNNLVVNPTKKIVNELKKEFPQIPIIGFAKGCGFLNKIYAESTAIDCLAIDQFTDRKWAVDNINGVAFQGNLDNYLLAYKPELIFDEVTKIINDFDNVPFVFNLGHGILPETPLENVEKLVKIVRGEN